MILNSIFIYRAWCLYRADQKHEHALAIKIFNFSIVYLFLLFTVLIIDHQFGVYL